MVVDLKPRRISLKALNIKNLVKIAKCGEYQEKMWCSSICGEYCWKAESNDFGDLTEMWLFNEIFGFTGLQY